MTGPSRYQSTLFPEVLDEVVGRDDPVRVIDAFVEGLDLEDLGFSKVAAEETGRPPYAPCDLLKLYIYGYLHRVRASRRLEAETRRNVQVMWLINRLTPSFKTIADFRQDHAEAIVGVCRAFIRFCREQSLFGAELLAIDGTKIAAVASRKQVMTPKRIEKMNAAIDRRIADYLASMDEADRQEPGSAGKPADVAAAIEALKAQKERLQGQAQDLTARGLKQMVMTEQDAKLMRTPHGHAVAYNAQIAVDAEHKLIGFCLTTYTNYATSAWIPPFLARVHHLSSVEIGTYAGTFKGLAGMAGTLVGGLVVAQISKRDDRWKLWAPAIMSGLAGPVFAVCMLTPDFKIMVAALALTSFLVGFHLGPIFAIAQTVAKPSMRALASAIILLTATCFGQGVGPLAVGMINDALKNEYGANAVRYSLLSAAVTTTLGALLFIWAARSIRADIKRAS
ncbi:MAG: MFS transporter [Bradyrhizobium sp.]